MALETQDRTVNVLLTTFAGLALPTTTCLPYHIATPLSTVVSDIYTRLPSAASNTVLTTVENQHVDSQSKQPLSSLINDGSDFLTLQIRGRLCGGKGGFGSQLRAAGGRMSSRKNRQSQADINASSRNLDGRRIRTITEAKNLAEYLALKPEMDKKQREARRQKWEAIVELAEKKQDELHNPTVKVRLDGDWVEAKEEAESKTREAVIAAMRAAEAHGESSSASSSSSDAQDALASDKSRSSSATEVEDAERGATGRSFFGWDEEDDEDSEIEDNDNADRPEHVQVPAAKAMAASNQGVGKGKAKNKGKAKAK